VKGRRFPSGNHHKQYWRNWSTWDDLRSLARWQDQLGGNSVALFGFVYHVIAEKSPVALEQLFEFRGQRYAMLAVRAVDYIRFARPLSAKWQTVSMPAALFRQAAVPFDDLLPRRSASAPTEAIAATAVCD
jgi:hypothetical protein